MCKTKITKKKKKKKKKKRAQWLKTPDLRNMTTDIYFTLRD